MLRSPLYALCPGMNWLRFKWLFNLKTIPSRKTGGFYSLIVNRLLQMHPCYGRVALLNEIGSSFFLRHNNFLFFCENVFFIFFLGSHSTLHFWNRNRFIFLFLLLCVAKYFYDATLFLLLWFLYFNKIIVLLFLTFCECCHLQKSWIIVDPS